jgi:hypothetical protein
MNWVCGVLFSDAVRGSAYVTSNGKAVPLHAMEALGEEEV